MENCKDCHNCAFDLMCRNIGDWVGIRTPCSAYKDRSRFVELPCKLGDTLFVPTRNFVSEYKIVSFHVCGEGIWYRTNVIKGILTRLISDNVENVGKTVFLTREEAEQALKLKERES